MGHYYSEIVSDEEREAERRHEEQRLQVATLRVKETIEKEGLERVLARILVATGKVWAV